LDFQSLTPEFGLAKEFQDQSSKGVFIYFHVSLPGNEFFGPKTRKIHGPKNGFSTLALEFFFQYKFSCQTLKIPKKIQKSTSSNVQYTI
jgi:hypothetical protein